MKNNKNTQQGQLETPIEKPNETTQLEGAESSAGQNMDTHQVINVNLPNVSKSNNSKWFHSLKQKVSFFDSILWLFPFYFVLAFMFIAIMGIFKVLLRIHEVLYFPETIKNYIEYLIFIFSACLLIHFIYSFFIFSLKQWKKKHNTSEIEEVGEHINQGNQGNHENKNPTT